MNNKKISRRGKPLALMIGTGLSLASVGAQAAALFQATDLASGYAVASADDGKKPAEHACGEGGCGASMGADKKDDAKPSDDKSQPAPAPAPAPKK